MTQQKTNNAKLIAPRCQAGTIQSRKRAGKISCRRMKPDRTVETVPRRGERKRGASQARQKFWRLAGDGTEREKRVAFRAGENGGAGLNWRKSNKDKNSPALPLGLVFIRLPHRVEG